MLHWLPPCGEFREVLRAAMKSSTTEHAVYRALACHALDFVQTGALDQAVLKAGAGLSRDGSHRTIRLALLGSSTVSHLQPSIRVAGLRRGFSLDIYEADYGQYHRELFDENSGLHRFKPEIVLFALDARHLAAAASPGLDAAAADAAIADRAASIVACWRQARAAFRAAILQQAGLGVFPDLIGNNEHRLTGSKAAFIERLNAVLRTEADREGAHVIAIDRAAARHGLARWHDPAIWHRSKQEVALPAAPFYGDLVGRSIAAILGRSSKCLVLDLDNTLWGGVIGDDGLDGIILGQGSAVGEAFAEIQSYASDLSDRGVILAVCSKNDEPVALAAFETHPEMVLKRARIASFVANWEDKATNLRRIASELNIGLDSLVFLDDNPFERNLVRQELPMVQVPEFPDDPALVVPCLADAGYFESVGVTGDDRARTRQYQVDRVRQSYQGAATDIETYLRGLDMTLTWRRFDRIGLPRIVQLINKTNQFNLTTRRTTEAAVADLICDEAVFGLQFRLADRFGDNGIIAIVIGRKDGAEATIDTWLMSCRVLGREVERATLDVVVNVAAGIGADRLIGQYIPTDKNAMVEGHYAGLGFSAIADDGEARRSALSICDYRRPAIPMAIEEAA